VGVVSPGRGRLRAVLVAAAITTCTLAWASASFARPAGPASGHTVAAARCAPLTLKKGASGLLKLTPARGSLTIVSSRLTPGTRAKTKARTITKVGTRAFRYALSKRATRGERVRLLVGFGKGKKVLKWKTISCSVRLGKPAIRLTVTLAGGGDGTVTSTPAGMSCANYAAGKRVRFSAAADDTSEFTGWGGPCTGTRQCMVTAKAAKTVTANFAKKHFDVTIQKAGDGLGTVTSTGSPLNCGTTCSGTFEVGTIIRLRAEPDAKSRFVGWTGACSSTATQCIFTVDAATTVTATFALKGFRLIVSRAGDGGGTITAQPGPVDCGATCSATYDANSVVTLTATPDSTSLVAGWTGPCQSSTPTTCTVTMDATKFIAATFVRGVMLTVAVNTDVPAGGTPGNGTGAIVNTEYGINCSWPSAPGDRCSALVFPAATIRLEARPGPGSSFTSGYWYRCVGADDVQYGPGNCEGSGSQLTGRTIVAHFTSP
jgi:List-Bact-rpt repeat protein